jgi:hypothetical protein
MKKSIPLFLLGLAAGGLIAWLALRHDSAPTAKTDAEAPAAAADTAEKPAAGNDIAVAFPKSVVLPPEVSGYGRVLDPAPLVALAAEVAAAQAAAEASSSELARVTGLHDHGDNASLQVVEAAQAAARRDGAQLMTAKSRLIAGWGREAAAHSDFAALARDLTEGNAALVRIDLPPEGALASPPSTARVSPLLGSPVWHEVAVLGAAPVSDAQIQGTSYLALWRGQPLAIGTALQAVVAAPGQPQTALLVSRDALVRYEGGTFVYVQKEKGGYEKRLVEVVRTLPDGVVLSSGIGEQDRIVVTGAQQLLATEVLGSTAGASGGGD